MCVAFYDGLVEVKKQFINTLYVCVCVMINYANSEYFNFN